MASPLTAVSQSCRTLAQLLNITTMPLDNNDPASVAVAVEAVATKTGGSLDYLLNNSSLGFPTPLLDSDLENGEEMFNVNFWGVLRITQAFHPFLLPLSEV
jgi:1-acylglycerone phosphate reductase